MAKAARFLIAIHTQLSVPQLQNLGITQQLPAAHVTGGTGKGFAGIGTGTTQIDVFQSPESIKARRRIVGIRSVKRMTIANEVSKSRLPRIIKPGQRPS